LAADFQVNVVQPHAELGDRPQARTAVQQSLVNALQPYDGGIGILEVLRQGRAFEPLAFRVERYLVGALGKLALQNGVLGEGR